MYIPRFLEAKLHDLAQFFPSVVCTGARQVGKTTLLRKAFPDHTYVSLDLPTRAAMAEETPGAFLSTYPAPVLVDEVQYAPGLFRYLKSAIDEDRHAMGRFILTGSQKFQLMQHLSESLAGRVGIAELEPLSWQECRDTAPYDLPTYISRGGFPELARVPELDRDVFMDGYVATYLERDVRQILNVGSLRDFERFMRLLATRNAQQLDLTAAGRAIGITTKTASAWVSVLETSRQITLLEPWFGNVGKRIVKTPKLYFNDTGLLCWLLGIDSAKLSQSPFWGSIWETAVFAELRKEIQRRSANRRIYYYRDVDGTEVDFLVIGDGARLVEAKTTENPSKDAAAGILRLAALADKSGTPELRPLSAFVVCRTAEEFPLATSKVPVVATGIGGVGRVVG